MVTEYIPGSCNIGASEVRQRQVVAVIGFVLFLVSAVSLFLMNSPRSSRLILFLPLIIASIGWVQSRKKFCLAFGFMGTFNFGKLGQLSRVNDNSALRADKITALSILAQSLLYAALVTALMYSLPTSL